MKTGKSLNLIAALLGIMLGAAFVRLVLADDSNIKMSTTDGSTVFGFQNSAGNDIVTVSSSGTIIAQGTVQISSNTVLPGTTFFQNATVVTSTVSILSSLTIPSYTAATLRGK